MRGLRFRGTWLQIAAGAALFAVAGCSLSDDPFVGTQAPELDLIAATGPSAGKPLKLSDYKGKVVLLEFWATWCGPCRAMMPYIDQMNKEFADKGLQVVAISNEDLLRIQAFRNINSQLTYPVFQDPQDQEHTRLHVYEIPQAFVLDRSGSIVFHDTGGSPQELYTQVRKALDDKG